ncbi:MAG: polysaccharide deacetylase [Clostridium butyricum]|nr:polysaccharide deacetylase [Clostridium butyricum]
MRKTVRFTLLFLIINMIFLNFTEFAWSKEIPRKKIVYLTFDDGPSFSNTDAILDVLCRNNIKATFCVVGENVILNKRTTNRLNKLGMGIIPHCNCHEYSVIYSSLNDYINDLHECEKNINNTIGENRTYRMVRMPGGSANTVCNHNIMMRIKEAIKNMNMYYIDWNLDCGDTHMNKVDKSIIEQNVMNYAGMRQIEVVLMHDLENKRTTTESLQSIIEKYKELGYEFKTLDNMEEWEIEYLIKNKVINRN